MAQAIENKQNNSGNQIEVLFAAQGKRDHYGIPITQETTVAEFMALAVEAVGHTEDLVALYLEDGEEPLGVDLPLAAHLTQQFSPLHLGQHHQIMTAVEYNGAHVTREFKPSTTVKKVIKWAIGSDGFNLEGKPHDFQLKYKGEVVPPDTHLGQIWNRLEKLKFKLVFKVKPQG